MKLRSLLLPPYLLPLAAALFVFFGATLAAAVLAVSPPPALSPILSAALALVFATLPAVTLWFFSLWLLGAEAPLQALKGGGDRRTVERDPAPLDHEFHLPLRAIVGAGRLLGGSGLEEEQREYLEIFMNAAEMLRWMGDRDESRSAKRRPLHELPVSPFDPRRPLESAARMVVLAGEGRRPRIFCHISSGAPRRVVGDEALVRRLLVNLIGGVVGRCAGGELEVVLEAGAGGGVLFRVSASGGEGRRMPAGGEATADGVERARELSGLLSGALTLEAGPGRGLRAELRLPLKVLPGNIPDCPLEGVQLRLFSDHPLSREALVARLEDAGAKVRHSSHGIDRLPLLRGRNFDGAELVLVDRNLQPADQLPALEVLLRRFPAMRILLLDHVDREESAAFARGRGIHFVAKPLIGERLIDRIVSLVGERPARVA